MSDPDETHDDPRGTYAAWLEDQRAANECAECGAWMPKVGTLCLACTPETEDE